MKKTPEEKTFSEKDLHLYLKSPSDIQFSVHTCANQPPGFSVRGKSTPNGLFQTISWLKNINGLHQTTPSTKT